MAQSPGNNPPSNLLIDDAFASGSNDFVTLLRQVTAPKFLAGIADRWKIDHRPWAREQIFEYLKLPLDRPGHHPVIKRLFKHAEAKQDHELMLVFARVFDRLIRRQRQERHHWDYRTRQLTTMEVLVTPRNQIASTHIDVASKDGKSKGAFSQQRKTRIPKKGLLFSYATRGYLRRRSWRYFRRIAFKTPHQYAPLVARLLAGYTDDDFATGENILDNWSLLNAAFRRSPVLVFGARNVSPAAGASMRNLAAAPAFPQLWKKEESGPILLDLVTRAESRLVRLWAIHLLKQDHAATLRRIDAAQLLALLDHDDEDLQQFGASLIESLTDANNWTVDTWLRLLETRSVTALSTICDVMVKRVSPERFSPGQCVTLACARATPVARLGLSWLNTRSIADEKSRAELTALSKARCEAMGEEIARYALGVLGDKAAYSTHSVIQFFDSLNPTIRKESWNWLTPQSAGYHDAALWSCLLESPFDDVRMRLIVELNKRKSPGLIAGNDLTGIWTSVLLSVHRGGRSKLTALRQICSAIAAHPEKAEQLIPVLSIAIRSVRPAEARAGLASLLSAVAQQPSLELLLGKHLPELQLSPMRGAS